MKQKTIKNKISIEGIGLHTGEFTKITFHPDVPFSGIKFRKVDIEGHPIIPADVDYVVDTSRCTVLGLKNREEVKVSTVEHVLAALTGLGIDNIIIDVEGIEIPILDGSSSDFVNLLKKSGIIEQNALRKYYEIKKPLIYEELDNNIEMVALPMDDYRVTAMVDYNSPILSTQHALLNNIEDFADEISPSRTFCFLSEVESLLSQGLVKGGNTERALVIVDKLMALDDLHNMLLKFGDTNKYPNLKLGDIINISPKLRFKNELARHKLLDVIGDLTLMGKYIKGQILAVRPGHRVNVAFAKKLKAEMNEENDNIPIYDPKLPSLLDINGICEILPHRYPFLLIDKIIHLDDKVVTGVKNITANEPFFSGHFPENPVFPGVLQIEAMAQIGGILVLNTVPKATDYWAYFMGVDNFKFRRLVIPGDTLVIRCELTQPIRRGIAKMKGVAYVGDDLVCEGNMSASLVKKK